MTIKAIPAATPIIAGAPPILPENDTSVGPSGLLMTANDVIEIKPNAAVKTPIAVKIIPVIFFIGLSP